MPKLSIHLLGRFEVVLGGEPAEGFTYNKLRALLAYLAVEAARPQMRGHLAALLWPDVPERLARQNLSQALKMLRGVLGERAAPGDAAAEPFLLVTSDSIQLNPHSDYTVDTNRFMALLAAVEAHQHRAVYVCAACIDKLRQAVDLYHGDLLVQLPWIDSELFDEWAQTLRQQLHQQAIGALERLAQAAEWRQEYGEAAGYTRRQLALAPHFEPGQRELRRLLALDSPSARAVGQPEQLCAVLASEAGPKPETAAPRKQVRDLRRGTQATLWHVSPPGNLPTKPRTLLRGGRELAEVCAWLRDGSGRILTIAGAPGAGKTRLALEAARAMRFEFADGAYLVELAPLDDPAQVLPAIARTLAAPSNALAASLRERHLLLVLDGFERVLDAAPEIAALLVACPALSVLATSQLPLRVRAERRYYVTAFR